VTDAQQPTLIGEPCSTLQPSCVQLHFVRGLQACRLSQWLFSSLLWKSADICLKYRNIKTYLHTYFHTLKLHAAVLMWQ